MSGVLIAWAVLSGIVASALCFVAGALKQSSRADALTEQALGNTPPGDWPHLNSEMIGRFHSSSNTDEGR